MDKALLNEAADALIIQDVVLHESNIRVSDRFSVFKGLGDRALETQFRFGGATDNSERYTLDGEKPGTVLIDFRYMTGLRLVEQASDDIPGKDEGDDEATVLVEIEAVFSTIYLMTNPDVSEAALNEFARYNVGYHVWPYWREYAASTFSRMRLPPVVIPFYRIPNGEEADNGKPD